MGSEEVPRHWIKGQEEIIAGGRGRKELCRGVRGRKEIGTYRIQGRGRTKVV